MHIRRSLLAVCVVPFMFVLTPGRALADSFGLSFFSGGFACQIVQFSNQCQSAATTIQNAQQYSYSNSVVLTSGSTSSSFSGSIAGTALHASSITNVPAYGNNPPNGVGHAYNAIDEYWFDTFNFKPGIYDIGLFFSGSVTTNLPNDGSIIALLDTFNLVENGNIVVGGVQYSGIIATIPSPGSHQDVQLSFSTPTTVTLGELLLIRNYVRSPNVSASGFADVDNLHTGYFTVTPVTQNGGFTTASGQTYTGIAAVPEPSSVYLIMGVIGILVLKKKLSGMTLSSGVLRSRIQDQ